MIDTHPQTIRLVYMETKPVIVVGFGNHDCIRYELTWDQLRGLVLDAMPELLRR